MHSRKKIIFSVFISGVIIVVIYSLMKNPEKSIMHKSDNYHQKTLSTDNVADAITSAGTQLRSPSGSYIAELTTKDSSLKVSPQQLYVRISSDSGKVLFESLNTYAAWHSLRVAWDNIDRLWVNSSDVGVHIFAFDKDKWEMFIWQKDGPTHPDPNITIWDAETRSDIMIMGGELPSILVKHDRN